MLFNSQILTKASGSVGGLTASHNRYGQYMRARVVPVNPATSFQTAVRNALGILASRWQMLTDLQRDAWDTYGLNVPVVNKLGDTVNLTGFNMYVRSNTPRIQAAMPIVDDGPTIFSLPTFNALTVTATVLTGAALVNTIFDDTEDWCSEDDASLLIYIARPVAPSINFFKGPFRFGKTMLGDSVTPITSPQLAPGAFAAAVGQKQYVQYRLTRADGRLSTVQGYSTILV